MVQGRTVIPLAALHAAICCKRTEIVDLLCKAGADINQRIYCRTISAHLTPFLLACYCGHLNEVDILFRYGVTISGSTSAEHCGESPLLLAFYGENNALVLRLLEEHVQLDVKDNNHSALEYATQCGTIEVLKMMIEGGADLQISNPKGCNPLLCSMKEYRVKEACLLLQHGATLPSILVVPWHSTLDMHELDKVLRISVLFASKSPRFKHLYMLLQLLLIARPNWLPGRSRNELCKSPFSLKNICRECIRLKLKSKVRTSIIPLINLLPFPKMIKEFLAFSELNSFTGLTLDSLVT